MSDAAQDSITKVWNVLTLFLIKCSWWDQWISPTDCCAPLTFFPFGKKHEPIVIFLNASWGNVSLISIAWFWFTVIVKSHSLIALWTWWATIERCWWTWWKQSVSSPSRWRQSMQNKVEHEVPVPSGNKLKHVAVKRWAPFVTEGSQL